ncbi:hypothetical protein MACK_001383 [Theileria orientalis]|uniref:Uncharacterized protein n=1 Tax=Theileria orientalis TaxID=68886 RepID=A0A976QV99_THEOR|nr:hypothetical protein MACK_001383 [Theileria orientalis]
MEDYQRWRRRELNEKSKRRPEYRYFPNRTAFHTFGFTLATCLSVMGISSLLMMVLERAAEKNDQKKRYQERFVKTDMFRDNLSLVWGSLHRGDVEFQRRRLNLPAQPASSVMIRDPEVKYPEPTGQVTL